MLNWNDEEVYDFCNFIEENGGKIIQIDEYMDGLTFHVKGISRRELEKLMEKFDRSRS